jgi:hypothetical protein
MKARSSIFGSFALASFAALSLAASGCSSASSGDPILHVGGDDGSIGHEVAPYDPNEGGLMNVDSGTGPVVVDASADAFWANDPPPMVCLSETGVVTPIPGGTPECPDDKNREGCPCPTEGKSAPCWPGLRKNRNRGVCVDGQTTCVKSGEFTFTWGACQGYVLPTPGATAGKEACVCFSGGTWSIANLSPCFFGTSATVTTGAVSTVPTYDSTGKLTGSACPSIGSGAVTAPSTPWSHTTLKTDCAGHFKLCYTLKAGDVKNPLASDCTVATVCAEGDYTTPNVEQKWPDLPSWVTNSATCAQKFNSTGGYGEMSVVGESVECNGVNKVFNRVGYCSSSCNSNPSGPGCAGCSNGGSGSF